MPFVQLFTMKSSAPCQKVKALLVAQGVVFDEVDVEANEAAVENMVRATGQWSVPALVIWGTRDDISSITHRIVGFEPAQIKRAVEQLAPHQ